MADDELSCDQLRQYIKECDPKDKDRQRWLLHKCIECGCVDDIPDDWGVEVNGGR